MNCVSEQGKIGLLWTVFEDAPFSSRRICSFADPTDAREYMQLMTLRKKKALVLYFETDEDVAEFTQAILAIKPNLKAEPLGNVDF